MKKNIKIEDKRIYLKTLTEENASEKYCSWINDPSVHEYLESKKKTVEELKQYIKLRYNDPNCLFLGIFLKSNSSHIGNIKLEPIDFKNKEATLGILIGDKKFWNQGFATEALKLVVDYAFKELKLDEVNLGVYKENIGAIKVYKKTGFKIYDEDEKVYKMKVLKEN